MRCLDGSDLSESDLITWRSGLYSVAESIQFMAISTCSERKEALSEKRRHDVANERQSSNVRLVLTKE